MMPRLIKKWANWEFKLNIESFAEHSPTSKISIIWVFNCAYSRICSSHPKKKVNVLHRFTVSILKTETKDVEIWSLRHEELWILRKLNKDVEKQSRTKKKKKWIQPLCNKELWILLSLDKDIMVDVWRKFVYFIKTENRFRNMIDVIVKICVETEKRCLNMVQESRNLHVKVKFNSCK